MKGIGKKLLKASLALALALSIGLIPAMPTVQASDDNWVNMDFIKAYMHSTEFDSVDYDDTLPASIMTGTGLHNPDDVVGEENVIGPSPYGGPVLTFTPGDVTITEWETQGLRPGTEYIWDLNPIPENEGRGRSVSTGLEGVSFQPGYTVNRTVTPTEFPGPGTYTQTLDIDTTPAESMLELVIVVQIPNNPQLTATILDATGDGITPDNWSANGAEISIPGPTTTTYSQTFTIEVEVFGGSVSFKPEVQVIAWYGVTGGTWVVEDYTVTRPIVLEDTWTLGTWTWDTSEELYDRHYNEQLAKVVHFPGSGVPMVNQVHVAFETGQTYNTNGDVVDGNTLITTQPNWINSHCNNWYGDNGEDVIGSSEQGGPLLYLNAENVVGVDENYLVSAPPPGPTEYIWGYPPISPDNNQQGYAEIGEPVGFTTGFNVEREVNTTLFTSAGGTQYLVLSVTPTESMEELNIGGQANMREPEIARIVNVEPLTGTPVEDINIHFEDQGFNIDVYEPVEDQLYQWRITIDIGPLYPEDITAEIEYMPFIQVRNIVDFGDSGEELGSSLEQADMTGLGSWRWEAEGEYLWNWVKRVVKEANLNGYTEVSYQAEDLVTERHFHLSNQTLHLYDGAVVPDGSQWINGNLFTFTHPGTPSPAEITSWSYINDVNKSGHGTISGSFTMTVHRDPCPEGDQCFDFGPIDGTISISFNAVSYGVAHPFNESEPFHYNFQGTFQITEGTGFYQGISGSGTIGGTFHDHSWSGGDDPLEKWFDFVMIGQAKFGKK